MLSYQTSTRQVLRSGVVAVLVGLPLLGLAQTRPAVSTPGNIDNGLKLLLLQKGETDFSLGRLRSGLPPQAQLSGHPSATVSPRIAVDLEDRVTTYILLDGSSHAGSVEKRIVSLGGEVRAKALNYGGGMLTARLPLSAISNLAQTTGIKSITLAHRGRPQVGLTTSQGAIQIRSTIANGLGVTGKGVTVGILSDSWDTSSGYGVVDTALQDVSTGDLPDEFSSSGVAGLKYLVELNAAEFGPGTDEGRAMGQIIHDVAPKADLCFATAIEDELTFATNATDLRTNPACAADVLVDDLEFEDEPFFSDGYLAQTLQDLATDNSLPGRKLAVVSASGNEAQEGYAAPVRFISDRAARAIPPSLGRVNLSTIPSSIDTSGGFHNFSETTGTQLAEDIAYVDGTDISFQWDDPFNLSPSGITTDLNLLFFDPASGAFLFAVDDDNFQTNQPLELFTLSTGNGPGTVAELLMVVARTGRGTHLATQIKYLAFGGIFDVNGLITAQTPLVFGHSCASSVTSVGAMLYDSDPAFFGPPRYRPEYETYSSPGPSRIYFSRDGSRLASPELRLKPDVSGPDGVNTTFFPEAAIYGPGLDYEAYFGVPDGFPNFFGTSAAAPHIAGIEALLLERAGGPGSLPPSVVNAVLTASAPPRDRNLLVSEAESTGYGTRVSLFASGVDSGALGLNTSFLTLTLATARPGTQLTQLYLDLTSTALQFDASSPVELAPSSSATIASFTLSPDHRRLLLTFTGIVANVPVSLGANLYFSMKGGKVATGASTPGADELVPASFRAALVLPDGTHANLTGSFMNKIGAGYSIFDGFGTPNAMTALSLLGGR